MLTYISLLQVIRNAESWLGHAYVLLTRNVKHLYIQAFCLRQTILFQAWRLTNFNTQK